MKKFLEVVFKSLCSLFVANLQTLKTARLRVMCEQDWTHSDDNLVGLYKKVTMCNRIIQSPRAIQKYRHYVQYNNTVTTCNTIIQSLGAIS